MTEMQEMRPGLWVQQLALASSGDEPFRGFAERCLTAHYENTCFGLLVGGQFVSFSAVHFSSGPRKNAWGRYARWAASYTPPMLRRKRHATTLWKLIRERAIAEGHDRVKSVAKGKLGYYLHRSLGHEFWGWDKGGRGLVVDSPLAGTFPDGIPIEARCAIDPRLMSSAELAAAESTLL